MCTDVYRCVHCTDLPELLGELLGCQLMERGYEFGKLSREFVKVLNNYKSEFERWVVPIDLVKWFRDIFDNSLHDSFNHSSPVSDGTLNFSQPVPEHTTARMLFYSQF